MKIGQESYEFIGRLALALYSQGIRIRLGTLQKILNDNGADYSTPRATGKAVSAAYHYWKDKSGSDGWVIHNAICASYTGQNDEYLFE